MLPFSPHPSPWPPPPGDPWWIKDVEAEIQFQHSQPLLLTGEAKFDEVIQSVIDGPVKLVRLVTG